MKSNIKIMENYVKKILNESEQYNGWTNFDTWAVSEYINNEEPLYNILEKHRGKITVDGLKKIFELLRRYNRVGYDEVDKKNVNWQEIVDSENVES